MRTLFEIIGRHGFDIIMNPDRFRELLVIVFTGIGEHPAEILHTVVAWTAALIVAERIYPKTKPVRIVTLRLRAAAPPRQKTHRPLPQTQTRAAAQRPH